VTPDDNAPVPLPDTRRYAAAPPAAASPHRAPFERMGPPPAFDRTPDIRSPAAELEAALKGVAVW
jgi:hypothetical protein